MGETLGTLLTMTTYGTWLRGDARGWVDEGIIFPPQPQLEARDRARLKHAPFLFDVAQLYEAGRWIGDALVERLEQQILALTVQTWHVHVVVGATHEDAARWGVRSGRPIWSRHYDKRFCFDRESLVRRVRYVERHNARSGLASRPWGFVEGVGGVPPEGPPGVPPV